MSTPHENNRGRPTADDIAGIMICVEGKEDCTPRPRPKGVRLPPCPPPGNRRPTADDLAGQPVCVEQTEPKK